MAGRVRGGVTIIFAWSHEFALWISLQNGTFQIEDPDHQLTELKELENNPLKMEEIVQDLLILSMKTLERSENLLVGLRRNLRPNEPVCN